MSMDASISVAPLALPTEKTGAMHDTPQRDAAQGNAMRVLVVDDNRDILELVQRVLRAEGHDVVIARDGLEALQQESATQPDFVVLDVNLPVMNGWEVCRRIKERRSVPVMLLTVRAERADIEESRAAGADHHLLKPFDIADFLEHIADLAGRPGRALAAHKPD
jgi:CheY-like chemotaxis protein